MNRSVSTIEALRPTLLEVRSPERTYPRAGRTVSGLEVGEQVDNMGSIGASLFDYEIMDGIREVGMGLFKEPGRISNTARVRDLANEIKRNAHIDPLIVVHDFDPRGPYILEGGHRFSALRHLGVKSFPALVVVDLEKAP